MNAVFSIRDGETLTHTAYIKNAPLWSKETLRFVKAMLVGKNTVARDIEQKRREHPDTEHDVSRLSYRKPTMAESKNLGLVLRPGGKFAKVGSDHFTVLTYTDYGYEYSVQRDEITIYAGGRITIRITHKNIGNYIKLFSAGPEFYRAVTFDKSKMTFRMPPEGDNVAIREYQRIASLPEKNVDKEIARVVENKIGKIDWYIRPDEADDILWPVTKVITLRSRLSNEKLRFYFRGPVMYVGMPFGRLRIAEFKATETMYTYLCSLCHTRGDTLTALARAIYEYKRLYELQGQDSVKQEFEESVMTIYNRAPWTWLKTLPPEGFIKQSEEFIENARFD